MALFVTWYNRAHRHSAIRYVTPDERHSGSEREILAKRHELYQRARGLNPERWTGSTGNWAPVGIICYPRDRNRIRKIGAPGEIRIPDLRVRSRTSEIGRLAALS